MEKTDRAHSFDTALDTGTPVSESLFYSLMADYPYFLPAMVSRLADSTLPDDERQKLLAHAATTIGNRADLYFLVGNDGKKRRRADKAPANNTKSTMDTITHFLDTFGNNDDAELRALEQRIFNPTPDYAQLLAQEEEKSVPAESGDDGSSQDERINKFIARSKRQNGRFPKAATVEEAAQQPAEAELHKEVAKAPKPTAPQESDPTLLSESLAKIYIRQHKYEKALEIIQSLSLNYSEKSIYFADQIRFLKKLIENEKYKQNKQ